MLCATSSGDAYWPSRRLKPRSATLRIERSLPAPIHTCGCGFCAAGGATPSVVKLPVLPAMRETLIRGPGFEQDFQAFLEPRVGLVHRHFETGELVVAIALAD